jgi:N-acetyltransferase
MSFDFKPVLEGPTLRMRPAVDADFAPLFAVASDPKIWALHPAHDRWQAPVFRAYFDEGLAGGGQLVAELRDTGRIIGASRYSTEFCELGEIEIGWTFLARSHWGGPTNWEMKRLMIAHALTGFDTVIFRIGETNWRSRRALEKIGGTLLERTQIAQLPAGPVLHLIYAIDRENFESGPLIAG